MAKEKEITMESKNIFISYKSEEFDDANWVREKLEENGISCWMAPMSIRGGASYASEIPSAIRKCKVFVLILSEKAQLSKWIPRELDQAINDNKVIMPFMVENCPLQDDFNFYLTNVQRYRAYEDKEQALKKMVSEILALPGINPIKQPAPIETKETEKEQNIPATTEDKGKVQPKKQAKPKKKSGIFLKVGAAIIGIIGIVILLFFTTTVKIGSERYSKSEEYLYLNGITLTDKDMDNIASLKKLRILSLTECVFEDENVGQMFGDRLDTLEISDCSLSEQQVASIDFSNMSLYRLDVSGNENFTSMNQIMATSKSLKILDISDTGITNLSGLESFAKLTELYANNNAIEVIFPIYKCEALSIVSLNGNQISDLSAFRHCTELSKIYVNNNKLKSLDGLENCIQLRIIEAGYNEITNIDGLSNATILEKVFLSNNQLEDVSILRKSADKLSKLYLSNNAISNIAFLEDCAQLTYITLDNNGITSLEPLSNAANLEGISASGNKLVDTRGIEGRDKLCYVNLANNKIITVGTSYALMLDNSVNAVLDLSGNNLETVNIGYSGKYRFLSLMDCNVADYSFLYSAKAAEMVINYDESIDFSALVGVDAYTYTIIGCPLDQQLQVKEFLGSYSVKFVDEGYSYDITEYYIYDMMGYTQ